MNELSIIFDRLDIRTKDVLTAAGTKWNFLKFTPGLVGGHCIGVDPYYLTSRAEQVGYHPQVILSGRRINDGMGAFIAQKAIRLLVQADKPLKTARVGILGLTFKENVPDLRNSRVPDIVAELRSFGIDPIIHDAYADAEEAVHEYNLRPVPSLTECADLDALIIAVPHHQYLEAGADKLRALTKPGSVIIDIKSIFSDADFTDRHYWSL
jgi:UDP-N-acetyl-D-galactosamine dehydrogenase